VHHRLGESEVASREFHMIFFQQEHADLVQSASSTTPATQKMDQGIRNTEAMPIQHRCKKN
jgi:hypothetical protein